MFCKFYRPHTPRNIHNKPQLECLVLDAGGLAILIRKMLGRLREPVVKSGAWATSRNHLVPDTLRTYWSGQSARHTLPSIAAALGVEKDRRDFLGRWCYAQHGSQDYILTSRQVVHGIQNFVSKCLLEGNADGGYIEEEVLSGVRQACADLSLDQAVIMRRHSVSEWDVDAKTWKLFGRFPHITIYSPCNFLHNVKQRYVSQSPHPI